LLKKFINRLFSGRKEFEPVRGYNLWSDSYDDQPDNLILSLDDLLFRRLTGSVKIEGAVIADIGCGTGRHWETIFSRHPAHITGFDVSQGMLTVLIKKFPGAETYLLRNENLAPLQTGACDILISTLAIAHMPNLRSVFIEWARVLKPGGQILVTDFHPRALEMGSRRSFNYQGKKLAVKRFIYPVEMVLAQASQAHLECQYLEELKVDESMKGYYEKKNALQAYDRFYGVPIIYGLILKKNHAFSKS